MTDNYPQIGRMKFLGFIDAVLSTPLGYIIYFAYRLTNSYGLAIVLFAVAVRMFVLFPVNIIAHRNSIRLLKLQPALCVIKRRFAGNKEKISQAQYDLFKKERYSPFVGLIPLFAQLILIIGIMQVMLNPVRHMHGIDERDIDFMFLGLNLIVTPSLMSPSPELIMPLLSVGSALCFCLVQNAISPGALSQSKGNNIVLTVFTVLLSLYLTLVLPVGAGLYWTVSNLAGIGAMILLNVLYSPKKLAQKALTYLASLRKTPEEQKAERKRKRELSKREKCDAASFSAAKKQIVFYAISGGQYKFYKAIIDYLLEHSEIVIHYLTNDPDAEVFSNQNAQLLPYYAGQKKTIMLMLKLNTDILVTTVPDLQSFHMKKSIVRTDIEYIHTFHGPTSTHLVYRENAFDHFDTLFCVGRHQVSEIRRREAIAKLPQKKLIKVGYGLYDQLAASYENMRGETNVTHRILIAPSWQEDSILDICIDSILDSLVGHGYEIVVRPHPQYIRLFPERMASLEERFAEAGIKFETDFSGNESIFTSDVLITDWSNIGYEFAYCTLKPCIFINTPMKVMNPNYAQYEIEPLEIALRDEVGVSVDVGNLGTLNQIVEEVLQSKGLYRSKIEEIMREYLYYPKRSGEAGGEYIIRRLADKNSG